MNINISSETEKALKEMALRNGQDAADYAGEIIEKQIQAQKKISNTNGKDEDDPDALSRAITRMVNRTPEEIAEAQMRAIATCKPQNEIPPGKTLFDMVAGKWPGDETDEQIQEALERLS
jgi:hypothetical protein